MWAVGFFQKHNCVCADTLFTTCEAKFFGGCGFDGDVVDVNAHHICKGFLHLGNVWIEFWTFCTNGAVYVADGVSFCCYNIKRAAEKYLGVDVFEFVALLRRKVVADVSHVGGSENGIANGMDEHICIGMTKQSEGVVNLDASEPKVATFGELVNIETKSDSYFTL